MSDVAQTKPAHLAEDARNALQGIRRALIELYVAVGANPEEPQDVARRFGLNRNLTWKLSKIINAPDPFASLNHLPGQQGLDVALKAFRAAGAPTESLDAVNDAMERLNGVIEFHAGDRDHFELTLESMGLFEREDRPENGRELAYRGNSMIWGVQAKVRFSTTFIAPSKEDPATKIDYVQVGGVVSFRRLRPTARWRLFRVQIHDDKGGELRMVLPEEIEGNKPGDGPLVLREFCSPNLPPFEVNDTREGREFLLPGGPVGNTSAFDCFFGYVARGLPRLRAPGNEYGSCATPITMPAENLVMDIIAHRDAGVPLTPEIAVYGFPHGGPDGPSEQTVHNRLPMSEKVIELAGSPPALATPLVPRYPLLAAKICSRMGWNLGEFRGVRLLVKHPPMSSRFVARWPLA